MQSFVIELVRAMEAREPVALVTVVGPFQLGAGWLGRKLLVRAEGEVDGSLGAIALDERVTVLAQQAMGSSTPPVLTALELTASECELLGLATGTELELFVETMLPAPTLLVVGAGHIAQPLARMAKMLGLEVVVVDDRPSFANRERFPDADRLIVADYGDALSQFRITASTYVVLVTRGHRHDEESLRQVIGSRAAYIGMIGSRRRVGAVLRHMEEDGYPAEQVKRICSPIGLDIGAETPEEIAVSILAEIVSFRRRGGAHPSSMSIAQR